jgi:hypothetical protein
MIFFAEEPRLMPTKLDDHQSAAKMGGESGPTGRAILFRRKKINKIYMYDKRTPYIWELCIFIDHYIEYKVHCTCSHRNLPILPSASMLQEI